MPAQQTLPDIKNNFSKGFLTEFTGLNFPPNAVTTSQNVVFERIGDVHRRLGINLEANSTSVNIPRATNAVSYYRWKNVGGDGSTQMLVIQVGGTVYFYQSTNATIANPLSTTKLATTVTLANFVPPTGSFDATKECQYADGQGFLFIYHPSIEPIYCTFSAGTITATPIFVQVRDFAGIPEIGVSDNIRPSPPVTAEHSYNLTNQGWFAGSTWGATLQANFTITSGSHAYTITSSFLINGTLPAAGQILRLTVSAQAQISSILYNYMATMVGNCGVTVSAGNPTLTFNTTSIFENVVSSISQIGSSISGAPFSNVSAQVVNISSSFVGTWVSQIGNLPSNSDVWYQFKTSSSVFNPITTLVNISLDSAPAPRGSVIFNAFQQLRAGFSGAISSVTDIVTLARPTTGCWHQGRVWFSGVNATVQPAGDAPYYTWTENIYFSQIYTGNTKQFSQCLQLNDPTSEKLFNLLPSDGGVIVVQGSGPIYKLFPTQNGLLVFAANGIWFIRGGSGLGFTASDYTVTKISSIQSFSNTSFVEVQGYPYWWNEEGIYRCIPAQQTGNAPYGFGGFNVESVTLQTIQSFYQNKIPLSSKKFARGDYDPLNWIIRWAYKSVEAGTGGVNVTTDTYTYDSVLCLNVITGAFYTYTIPAVAANNTISGIVYVQNPGGSGTPSPIIKYLTWNNLNNISFAEENSLSYQDFSSSFVSSFSGAYSIPGQAQRRAQMQYLNLYCGLHTTDTSSAAYQYQGIWVFAINNDTGKFTNLEQFITTSLSTDYSIIRQRHKVRGRGMNYQFYIQSVGQQPFDIIGWSVTNKVNPGV